MTLKTTPATVGPGSPPSTKRRPRAAGRKGTAAGPGASPLLRGQRRAARLMLLPAVLHSLVFIVVPTLAVVVLAFTDYSYVGVPSMVGFHNFTELFADRTFRSALWNTFFYTLIVVPGSMALALLAAVALNRRLPARGLFRTAFYLPVVTATVAVGMVWSWIFNPGTGLLNGLLGLIGREPVQWLTSPTTALPSLAVVGVWQGLGLNMVIYLAALQGVRADLIEAAGLDGANAWQRFRHVTWPALGPAHFFVGVTSLVRSFQVFDLVYVMTHGGPGTSTTVLVFDVYNNAFQRLRLGYAAAETVIMMVVVGALLFLGSRAQGADPVG